MDDGGFANGCSHEEEIPDMENEIECDEFDEEMDVDCDGPSQVVRKMNGKGKAVGKNANTNFRFRVLPALHACRLALGDVDWEKDERETRENKRTTTRDYTMVRHMVHSPGLHVCMQ